MDELSTIEILERLGTALAIGLLIGAERGWAKRELAEGGRTAGFRTYGLVALVGALSFLLQEAAGIWPLVVGFLGITGIVLLAFRNKLQRQQDLSATGAVALLVTFALGALAGAGELAVAGAVGVVVALLLGSKPQMHELLQRTERSEMMAVIKLGLISVVLLPILPDQGYGPWLALNPYRIWWMVVLVAGISLAGYIAIRVLGSARGILATALFGGLIASTATTMDLARMGKRQSKSGHRLLAAGVLLAWGTMFLRMLVVSAVVELEVALRLAPSLVGAAAACYFVSFLSWRGTRGDRSDRALLPKNPFEFWVALQFGLLLAAIMFLSKALQAWLGKGGLYLLAAASGLTDVDAITLSFSAMASDGDILVLTAALGMMLAAGSNTLVKAGLVQGLCGGLMARWVAAGTLAALALGFGLLFVPLPGT